MALQVHQFICLSDNFGILIHDPATGATAIIDAPEAGGLRGRKLRFVDAPKLAVRPRYLDACHAITPA